jgi:hypothetical protein
MSEIQRGTAVELLMSKNRSLEKRKERREVKGEENRSSNKEGKERRNQRKEGRKYQ